MSVASEQNCDVHLHAEIEVLKQALVEKQNQLIAMETACLRESDRQAELEDSIIAWQDKYDRLYESHKRVQKVNQSLEDKLLKLVDRNSGERAQLTSDVATLSVRLAQANYNIAKLQGEIERYKTDINLAIQLLQCKPDSFLPQKISSLPMDIQSKVSSYMRLETNSHSDSEGSTSGVGVSTSGSYKVLPASDSPPPVCPFPPTAMVYSMRGLDAQISESLNGSEQMISPSIMVKYLEDELKASEIKHCDTCKCSTKDLTVLADEPRSYSIGTQTVLQGEGNSLCLRCNSNLNSPSRTNSPYIMKLVKSSDSVISETKSYISDMNDPDKLFTQPKKDDLMVNPILGHHRLCDRTSGGKQNQQLCDTAKYFVENRKLDCDLIDFRKHNKSPKLAINNDNYNTYNRSLTSDTILNDASRKIDCSTLLLNTEIEKNDSNLIQGKGDISLEERKNDSKVHHESGSSGYSSAEKRNLQTTITGSTNSLWSKTSSSDGAKIFESFNRNLIKTIKAENPKYRGPRLCALRIQNGSNNILLDNIESEITPIVYTRRQRFLDEELDDTKDIITSKISMVMSNQATIPIPNCPAMEDGKYSINSGQIPAGEGNIYDINREDIEPICDAIHSNESDSKVALINNINMDNSNVSATNALSNQKLIQIDGNNERNLANSNSQINSINNCLELHCDRLNELGIINDSKLQQQKCFDDLDSYENCDNTKSCTQSSSISSNGADIDIQENAILRQQQLTRVAEWVKNNSHIDNAPNRKKTSNNNNNNNSINCSNVSNNCTINRHTENIPSSLSFNDSSIEKLSVDSGYKTTKLIQNDACNNTCTEIVNITSTNPIYCQEKFNTDNNFYTSDCIAQNSLVSSKYYFNEFAQSTPMHKMHKHKQFNVGNECKPQVNLAQMEYNVKQFLLKQNEWCIKNKSTNSSIISNGQNSILVNKFNSNNYESAAVKSHPRRTETNL